MRTDHVTDSNERFAAWAVQTALDIKQREAELERLRVFHAACLSMADTTPRADDPIFDAGTLPLGMTQTVGTGTIAINPRQPKQERVNTDEMERQLAKVVEGERVPA
jgi:hypothetical protein